MFKLPKYDDHFQQFKETGDYQRTPLLKAIKMSQSFRHAIDIGAHCGFFTSFMAGRFERVTSFEPCPENYACLQLNTRKIVSPLTLHNFALGDHEGEVYLKNPRRISPDSPINSGDWQVTDEVTDIAATLRTLDSFDLDPDFIKIDVQGYELNVLRGAKETILTHRPNILVEIVATPGNEVHKYLSHDLDMSPYDMINKDWCYRPNR